MNIAVAFIPLAWLIFIGYWVFSSFGIKRDIARVPLWRAWWLRMALAIFFLATALNAAPEGSFVRHWFTLRSTSYIILADILVAAGIALSIWARVHIGRNWSPAPALKEEHELITSGPYAYVRHPIYTGIILAALGSVLVNPGWAIVLIFVVGMFLWRVKREEALMLQEFPSQYPEYMKKTWALIPFIY